MAQSRFSMLAEMLILLSCLHVSSLVIQSPPTSVTTDRQALLSFKFSISKDSAGLLASWNDSLHFCHWRGVTCGRRHPDRVTELDLSSLGLEGTLSPALGNLTFLGRMDLSNNGFRGQIPPDIGRLFRLQHLNLSFNSLEGGIPKTLSHCFQLRVISLRNNELQGEIPTELSRCSNLQNISFRNNMLRGMIPPSVGNLSSLYLLDLSYNTLSGGIPPSLGKLSALQILALDSNNLTGSIPNSMWNLSSLKILDLDDNSLSGSLPSNIGHALPRLRFLSIALCKLHGSIPSSLSNASGLDLVQLQGNIFSGTIPPSLGTLENLATLILDDNQLDAADPQGWSFLTALTNCTKLSDLELDKNNLGGMVPNSIANLSTTLQFLTLGENHISGSLPPEIGNLVSLQVFSTLENFLTGPIPASIGKLPSLDTLNLGYNKFSGEIPSTFGNLSQLDVLALSSNNLTGGIPSNLGNCQHLTVLDLWGNMLTGVIPQEVFTISSLSINLDLSDNLLSGSIPSEVGTLESLNRLDFSGNKLSGELPDSLGKCEALERLNMGSNYFHGDIPLSFRLLRGIKILDLSRNNLSGSIPSFLKDFQGLYHLNLSFNNFEGELPTGGVFDNASALSIIGNDKLCGGNPELHLQPCHFHATRKKHTSLEVVIISIASASLFLFLLFCLLAIRYLLQKSRRRAIATTEIEGQHVQVSYSELVKATNGFSTSNLIGRGSFGSVYNGILDGNIIAVKVFNLQQHGASKSFLAECEALRNVRHRNLVKILTICSSVDFRGNDFKAMVFKFMANGSLESWLYPELNEQTRPKKLNLLQRLNIALDVASALEYLHHHGGAPIVHCDLKPSNVLLDDDMTACVTDFGLARFLKEEATESSQISTSSIGMKGTIGYVAPEYGVANRISTQGDVYSFGILVLEMFTGKRPTDHAFKEGLSLRDHVKAALPDRVMDVVDERMLFEEEDSKSKDVARSMGVEKTLEWVALVLAIGLSCSSELPMDRAEMGAVTKELHAIRDMFFGAEIQERRRKARMRDEGPSTV